MSTTEHGHGHGHGHGAEGASAESVSAGHEVSDWQAGPVVVMVVATLGALALGFIVMAGLVLITGGGLGDTSHTLTPTGEAQAQLPPAPLLEQNPNVDGERMVAEATARLEGYGWVSEGEGVAHVPIERAKELLLERGISPFDGASGAGEAPAASATAPAAGVELSFDAALAAQGEQLFANLGCAGCHRSDGAGVGPSLEGVAGAEQPLEGGGSALADEAYLRESILNSGAKVVQGYQPVMPSYQGQLSDDQVAQLIEYLKSLGR